MFNVVLFSARGRVYEQVETQNAMKILIFWFEYLDKNLDIELKTLKSFVRSDSAQCSVTLLNTCEKHFFISFKLKNLNFKYLILLKSQLNCLKCLKCFKLKICVYKILCQLLLDKNKCRKLCVKAGFVRHFFFI